MINIGDTVQVTFVGSDGTLTGTVLHKPSSTGECWIIENDKTVAYVQTFEAIWKAKP